MTVKELIEKLEKMPPDAIVILITKEGDWNDFAVLDYKTQVHLDTGD